jgi:GNAT superfamily N-acetyltransferase
MEINIRKIRIQDAEPIAELLKDVGWFELLAHEPLEATRCRVESHIEQCLADNSHTTLVAELSDGAVAGYVSAHWLPYLFLSGPDGFVSELFARDFARGRGIGTKLLHTIETEARARGCPRLSLINLRTRDSYQRQFYVKAGWKERVEAANFIRAIS